ncbi:MAG: DUF3313 domain-containing protein [Verrucomicrobiales bacterium]
MKLTALSSLLAAGLTLLATSCGTQSSPSGFLTNFGQLGGGYDTTNTLAAYTAPGLDLTDYDSVYIEAPTTIIDVDKHDPRVAEQLSAYVVRSLRSEFGKRLKIVGEPGPRTIRVRTALTDIVEGTPATTPVTTVYSDPKAPMRGAVGSAAEFISSISFEGEALDGATGKRLAASSDQRSGTKRDNIAADTDWVAVQAMVEKWAAHMAERLEGAQAR